MQYINIGMRGRDMHAVPIDGTRDNAYIMHGEVRHTLYSSCEAYKIILMGSNVTSEEV